ncbi:alpha/beta hydrolase [Thermoplasmatales archaeon SW_10_69_26]|nr:MAG: alpha/beta hydrolase [Thermoplasmatales archaeon SW_10_69_26]
MPHVETNGITTYYEPAGRGTPIVFVHAPIVDHGFWRPQARELGATHQAVTYDLRGHGRTGPSDENPYTIDLFADDLQALIEQLDLENPLVCAHSMGGLIAQAHAAKHPDELGGLVLADPFTPKILTAGERFLRRVVLPGLVGSARLLGYQRVEKANVWLTEHLFAGSSGDDGKIQRLRQSQPGMETDEFAKVVRAMAHAHEHPIDLSQITVPTLVLHGEDDLGFVERQAEHLAAHLPDVLLEEIAAAGHAAHLDQPAAFNAAVRGFVEEIGDTKRGRAP